MPRPLSLSTCWLNHRHSEGREIAREARDLGFERIEVSHGTRVSLLPGLLAAVAAGEIQVSSVHNFCPSPVEILMDAPDAYEFTSAKEWERERAVSLTRKSLEMTARLGADRLVLHLGSVAMRSITAELEKMTLAGQLYSRAYSERKLQLVTLREKASSAALDRVKRALDELLPEAEKHGVKLGIETRSHYEQIPNQREMLSLLEAYRDCPWIGSWHDFGHVQRQANLALLDHALYLSQIGPRLLGCHVHDVKWPQKDHRTPLSTGGVALKSLLQWVPEEVPLVWELSPGQKTGQVREAQAQWLTEIGGVEFREAGLPV